MPTIALSPDVISERVRSFVVESFLSQQDVEQLGPDDELNARLDSLQLLRMVVQMETMFGIKVDNSELSLENLGSLRRIGLFVNSKLNR